MFFLKALFFSGFFIFNAAFAEIAQTFYEEYKVSKLHTLSVGPQLYFFDYKEVVTAPSKSNESGVLPGFNFNYRRDVGSSFFILGSLDAIFSSTNYDGSLQGAGGQYMGDWKTKTNNTIFELTAGLGYQLMPAASSFSLLAQGGIGFHTWTRDITGPYGLLEDYFWAVLPIGIQASYQIPSTHLEVGAESTLKLNLGGNVDVKLGGDKERLPLGGGVGFKQGLFAAYKINENSLIRVATFYEMINISEGKKVFTGSDGRNDYFAFEPASRTNIFGTAVTANFSF